MRGTKPSTPIPQVPHQRHISFPLSTSTISKFKPKYMVHTKNNPEVREGERRERKREKEREEVAEVRVWNAEARLTGLTRSRTPRGHKKSE